MQIPIRLVRRKFVLREVKGNDEVRLAGADFGTYRTGNGLAMSAKSGLHGAIATSWKF